MFFDVSKAFDTVPHLPLLQTLERFDVDKYILRWIKDYLLHRSQLVCIDGCMSPSLPAISGVPQGSVLGPLLFISYINDVTSVISEGSEINMFADDIALYRIIKSAADYNQLQLDIDSVSSCIEGKHLKFNARKCKYMLISRKRIHTLAPPSLTVDGILLTQVMEYKYLGVTIASDLSWSPYIMKLCNKARKIIGVFYRRFYRNSSSSTLLKLYLSHIRPHLEYCSAVWNPHLKGDITELEKVQKYALKVCMKSWDTSYEDLLATSNVPSLEFRRKHNSVCHLFKVINGLTDYPSPPINLQEFHYNVRSAGSNVLTIP